MLSIYGVTEMLAGEHIGARVQEALPEMGAAGPVDVGEVTHGWFFCVIGEGFFVAGVGWEDVRVEESMGVGKGLRVVDVETVKNAKMLHERHMR